MSSGRPGVNGFPALVCLSSVFFSSTCKGLVVSTVWYSVFFFSGLSRPCLIVGAFLYTVEELLDVYRRLANREEDVVGALLQCVNSIPEQTHVFFLSLSVNRSHNCSQLRG